jgi:hypothetical protein
LLIDWDSGSRLIVLLGEGDEVRLLARAADDDGTEPEVPEDGQPPPGGRQDITDPATGLSRLLSEQCGTCILRRGGLASLVPDGTRAIVAAALAEGSFVICHDTLTYGPHPGYGPAICRGFFDAHASRSRDLMLLRACRRLAEVPPPLVAEAGQLGRDAGAAAATWALDGSTPANAWQQVLRGIEDGDPAILDALEPAPLGAAAGYTEADLARDLGTEDGDPGLPRAAEAYADAFTASFWQETVRAAREHASG